MAFSEGTVHDYRESWNIWADRARSRYVGFKIYRDLRNLIDKIGDQPLALVIGSRISSLTNPFWDLWNKYSDISDKIGEDPREVDSFIETFQNGGLEYTPENGIDVIPDLVAHGTIPLLLVFNYNCHIELCLSACGIGYQSITYHGKEDVEKVKVGDPQCTILKPHGSSRIFADPTPIVWPNRQPNENYEALNEFTRLIEHQDIKHIVILAYSVEYDPYIKPYFQKLAGIAGMTIFQVDRYREEYQETTLREWGVVEKATIIQNLKEGAIDFLIGLSKTRTSQDVPCVTLDNPLLSIQKHFAESIPVIEKINVTKHGPDIVLTSGRRPKKRR